MSFAGAALSQYDVLRALVLRNVRTRATTSRFGYMLDLIEPTAWVLVFYLTFALGGRAGPGHGMEPLPFLATGICTFGMFSKTSGKVGAGTGFAQLPRVKPLDVMVANAILEVATMAVVFIVLLSGAYLLTGRSSPVDNPLQVVWGMCLASALGLGFGLVVGAGARYTPVVNTIKKVLQKPLFWVSGLFYVVEDLPSRIRDLFLYNPVLHAVELVRGGWFSTYHATHANSLYPSAWAAGLLLVGLTLERNSRDRQRA